MITPKNNLPPRDPSRAKLSEAIAKRSEIERQLAASRDAADKAARARWAAHGRLDALRQAREEAHAAQSTGTRFIASVAAGEPSGVDVLERPTSTRDEDALAREAETWARAQSECNAIVHELEQRLGILDLGLAALAREVIANSGTVAALLEGLEALHAEVDRRLSVLRYLDFTNAIAPADKEAVAAALGRPVLCHPSVAQWKAALEALARDHDAPLPGA